MILYSNQLVRLKKYDEPAIFIGYDKSNNKKLWVICIDDDDCPELDWFMEDQIDYYHVAVADKTTPSGKRIAYGKFKGSWIGNIMLEAPTDEEITKYGNYVAEMMEKYKTKETTTVTTTK